MYGGFEIGLVEADPVIRDREAFDVSGGWGVRLERKARRAAPDLDLDPAVLRRAPGLLDGLNRMRLCCCPVFGSGLFTDCSPAAGDDEPVPGGLNPITGSAQATEQQPDPRSRLWCQNGLNENDCVCHSLPDNCSIRMGPNGKDWSSSLPPRHQGVPRRGTHQAASRQTRDTPF